MTLQQVYEFMYYDLLSNRLEVHLIPSINPDRVKNGCWTRNVVSTNPNWYQDFCSCYPRPNQKKRKCTRTNIKRRDVLRLLKRLKDGKKIKSKYLPHLDDIAKELEKNLNMSDEDMAFFIEFGVFPEPFNGQF